MERHILLAEDDIDLGTSLIQYLEFNKFKVSWAQNGEEAFEMFKQQTFDICILDIMMPKMDGFSLAKKMVGSNPHIPFLFLTARKTKNDRFKGLRLGADDYIVKPFELEELILRVNNIIRRTLQQQKLTVETQTSDLIQIGKYTFDFNNLELHFGDSIQTLTEREAQLIYFFSNYRNQLIPREDILTKVWNKKDFFSGRSMDVFISRVRKFFKDDENISVRRVRGVGLEFQVNEESE
ncbi:response regulator transcription factor [Mangrovimonas xylaniphaga]|uniref:response regulator transcription factor n=1 Tax=Mangrovimonas xylaniphaga TaxID=1645915 RepID=UPI0006B4CF74|nr:response regulator transcription factor [Mangrovimonas xylaniphaga]